MIRVIRIGENHGYIVPEAPAWREPKLALDYHVGACV